MVVAGHRQGREVQNQGDNDSTDLTQTGPTTWAHLRTAANPMRYDGRSLLSNCLLYTSRCV